MGKGERNKEIGKSYWREKSLKSRMPQSWGKNSDCGDSKLAIKAGLFCCMPFHKTLISVSLAYTNGHNALEKVAALYNLH
ncbi:hypothetical protein STEG23_028526 [Scotinomys teguina]